MRKSTFLTGGEMNYRKTIIIILILLLSISIISSSFAANPKKINIPQKIGILKAEKLPFYDLKLEKRSALEKIAIGAEVKEKFKEINIKTKGKVGVIIHFKEADHVIDWKNKINSLSFKERKELNKNIKNYIKDGISKTKHEFNSFNGISATITEEEFNALAELEIIENIEYDRPMYISLQDSTEIINASKTWSMQLDGINLTGEGQSVCVIDTGVDYTHPDLGGCDFKNVETNGNTLAQIVESAHNYTDNSTIIWKINYTGFNNIAVHFSYLSVESGWDYIYILDGNNNTIKNYTGHYEDLWSPHVSGDTIYVKLVSDSYVNDTGFYIDTIINGTTNTTYNNWSSCNKVIDGYNFINLNNDPYDDQGHGTHCAGIVAANGNITGVAPDANIIAIKALDRHGSGWTSDIVAGIEYCTDNAEGYNISTISMSLGGGFYNNYCDASSSSFANAINSATNKNISVIIASGNEGSSSNIAAPACIENAIPVGATEKNDNFASYSNRNWMVQLSAPGSNINSTKSGGGHYLNSGTSMATPHVAGAFAIMNQYFKIKEISKTPQELEDIFNRSGERIDDTGNSNLNYTRIDLYEALHVFDFIEPRITILTPEVDNIVEEDYVHINISADETVYNTTLHITNSNISYPMSSSGTNWYYNLSGSGWYYLLITAEDASNNTGQSLTRHIFLNNTQPNITSISPAETMINISEPMNQTFSINISDDGPNTTIKWYKNGSLISSGTSSWTFEGGYFTQGSYNISVILNDSVLFDEHSWTLNIADTPMPLYWTHQFKNIVMQEDTSILYDINATNDNNLTINYFVNETVQIDNTTGMINYTPVKDWFGSFTINISATDSIYNISETIMVNVTPVNDAPIINFINLTLDMPEDTSTLVNLSNYVNDVDNITTTWNCSSNETDVNTSLIIDALNITAKNNFNGHTNITCIASDQELNDSDSFIINITAVNDAPIIDFSTIDMMEIPEDTTDTINLSTYITDIDNDYSDLNIFCTSNETDVNTSLERKI